MKGSTKVIQVLNTLLASELAAISQYVVHSSMCDNWGYSKQKDVGMARAKQEMGHADALIDRILFLEGAPIVDQLDPIKIGTLVVAQIDNDCVAESTAIDHYNAGIRICVSEGDDGSRELLEANLKDEEAHLNYLEGQLVQNKQMGTQNFLSTLV